MKIQIIAPALPPQLDGIGDYTARLAAELAKSADVEILAPSGREFDPIKGVPITPGFTTDPRDGVWEIESHVRSARPDWVLLQYNPFGYGRRGLNLSLPRVLRSLRRTVAGVRLAVMVHERYVPTNTWKFAVMSTWQRSQFFRIGNAADVMFFSIEPWLLEAARRFPGKPLIHLPVGSNVPRVDIDRNEARRRLEIPDGAVVLGIFGMAHVSRLFSHVRAAAEAIRQRGRDVRVLYMGPDGPSVRSSLGDLSVISDGPLPADEISRRLAAVDVYLAPYIDGVSTRRGAFIAGLQHRLPVVGTFGCHTDRCLLDQQGHAFLLTDSKDPDAFARAVLSVVENEELGRKLAAGGGAFHEKTFTWPDIARKLLAGLSEATEAISRSAGPRGVS